MPFWLLLLVLALPAAIAAHAYGAAPLVVFVLAALALVPLAGLMSEATDALARQLGPTVGGLLNATFGNAAELIIGVIALAEGLVDVVRASIAGSVIGNSLLVLGTAMLFGGWRHRRQRFSARDAGHFAALLALAVAGLVIPSITITLGGAPTAGQDVPGPDRVHALSIAVAVILLLSYVAYVGYSIFGLRALRVVTSSTPMQFGPLPVEVPRDIDVRVDTGDASEPPNRDNAIAADREPAPGRAASERESIGSQPAAGDDENGDELFPRWVPRWLHLSASPLAGLLWLGVATVLTAIASDVLVGAIEPVAHEVGLSPFFIGLIVVPIVANAGEHFSAITQAVKDQMDATMAITAGSAIQVALLLAPVLVLVSQFVGHSLDFTFIPLELVIFALVALLYSVVSLDGESTWLEGWLLLAFYIVVAIAAFFVPH